MANCCMVIVRPSVSAIAPRYFARPRNDFASGVALIRSPTTPQSESTQYNFPGTRPRFGMPPTKTQFELPVSGGGQKIIAWQQRHRSPENVLNHNCRV